MVVCRRRHKIILLLFVLALAVFVSAKPLAKLCFPQKYDDYVYAYAKEYGVPSELLFAVICCESGFRRDAVSKAGACGLMQLTEPTFSELCTRLELSADSDIFAPQTNIQCGTFYLRYLYDRYGNWQTALAAYNAGLGNVDAWLKDERYSTDGKVLTDIPYKETKKHVKKVFSSWKIYKELYKE